MTREELCLWLRLVGAKGVGSISAAKLLAVFGLPENIFSKDVQQLARVITHAQAQSVLAQTEPTQDLLNETCAWLQAAPKGQFRTVVSLADAHYPRLLLSLPDPPVLLFAMGSQARFEQIATATLARDIAIVGSRHATPQGLSNARGFAKAFADKGMNIISGLALGIDGAAHQGALDAQIDSASAGSTIAVVGTGLDRVYPKRHLDLAHRICQSGLILSEFLIGTAPRPENFPRRNRIIAALTQGTLVVEAAIQSGSLITARQALDLGKDVFAIPGSIHNPQSKGCHHLIKQGAKLVESAQDLLDELPNPPFLQTPVTTNLIASSADFMRDKDQNEHANQAQKTLLDALGHDPVSFDTLIDRTGIAAPELQVQLLDLELLGEVARLPGGLFQRHALA